MAGVPSRLWAQSTLGSSPERLARDFDLYPADAPYGDIEGNPGLVDFNGDHYSRPHGILWDKPAYLAAKGGIPAITETVPVVVVGGGISGLTAAFRLRDLGPMLLEQAPRFGGVAKAERWKGVEFGLGSAYVTMPDDGSGAKEFLAELGILKDFHQEGEGEAEVFYQGKPVNGFWTGATDPAHADQFKKVVDRMREVREKGYPEIPHTSSSALSLEAFRKLDQTRFSDWLQAEFGTLHPHVTEYAHEYCWSSFGASPFEISAAQALNFMSVDMEGMIALPGGNAGIAQSIYAKLKSTLPAGRMRAGCFVLDVALNENGVRVCYEDAKGMLHSVQAKACVVASPKFVAKHLIDTLSAPQREAMDAIQYRAYLVANVLIDRKILSPGFSVMELTGESITDPVAAAKARMFNDIVFASWAVGGNKPDQSVLTLYRALPWDTGRAELYASGAHARIRAQFEQAVKHVLPLVGAPESAVSAIRITRWGHALPLAAPGLLANGVVERAAAPIGGRIFFGQQDTWASPCFEIATSTGTAAAALARKAAIG